MKKQKVWYEQGLSFRCLNCGKCCMGAPGYVWLSPQDIEAISSFLKISQKKFLYQYTRFVKNKISLKELQGCYSCIFLRDKNVEFILSVLCNVGHFLFGIIFYNPNPAGKVIKNIVLA